jgi:hypothetical protein
VTVTGSDRRPVAFLAERAPADYGYSPTRTLFKQTPCILGGSGASELELRASVPAVSSGGARSESDGTGVVSWGEAEADALNVAAALVIPLVTSAVSWVLPGLGLGWAGCG